MKKKKTEEEAQFNVMANQLRDFQRIPLENLIVE